MPDDARSEVSREMGNWFSMLRVFLFSSVEKACTHAFGKEPGHIGDILGIAFLDGMWQQYQLKPQKDGTNGSKGHDIYRWYCIYPPAGNIPCRNFHRLKTT